MQLILKEKRVARAGALRVVDFATTRNPPACERWVDLTGLKQLFAIFMGKSKVGSDVDLHRKASSPSMRSACCRVSCKPTALSCLQDQLKKVLHCYGLSTSHCKDAPVAQGTSVNSKQSG